MRRWPRVLGRLWLLLSVLWVLCVVLIFSYGEPAPGQELLTALLPPGVIASLMVALARVFER